MRALMFFSIALLCLFATSAFAGLTPPRPLPEPGALALLGIGAAAGTWAAWRHRKQK